MTASANHKSCYGQMFPDLSNVAPNRHTEGKAFRAQIKAFGVAIAEQTIEADIGQWDDCRHCPEFEHCWRLCMSRAVLQSNLKVH